MNRNFPVDPLPACHAACCHINPNPVRQVYNPPSGSVSATLAGEQGQHAAIERWRDVSLLIFEQGQPHFVETSVMIQNANDIQSARDYLYRALTLAHLRVKDKLSDEKIEIAYVELFKFHPSMRVYFSRIVSNLQNAEREMFNALLSATEAAVLTSDPKIVATNSAALENLLRANADKVKNDYLVAVSAILKPAEDFLSTLILKTDRELLDQDNLKSP